MKYHYYQRCFTYSSGRERGTLPQLVEPRRGGPRRAHPSGGHCQVGSSAGAAHLLKDNAGVLRRAQRERKSREEQKGKSTFDSDFQYEYEL